MNRLSPTEAKQLHEALISGFSYDELGQLVQFELNERLQNIVGPGPLTSVAFELVVWTEQRGRTAELIKAVMAARPNNSNVAALGRLLQPTPVVEPALATADQQRRLRGLLLDQFPRRSDLRILLDESLGQDLDQVAGGENQTEVCFNLMKWLWIDRVGRLRPLLSAAVRERPNCDDLKALQKELFPG